MPTLFRRSTSLVLFLLGAVDTTILGAERFEPAERNVSVFVMLKDGIPETSAAVKRQLETNPRSGK
ncbi:MAG: hypothetical protein ACLUEV_04055 [Alistipes sp.]